MRYFTRGWANGELSHEEDESIRSAYEARLREVVPRLPASMIALQQGVSLHDALLESVRWTPSLAELRLVLVAGTADEVTIEFSELE